MNDCKTECKTMQFQPENSHFHADNKSYIVLRLIIVGQKTPMCTVNSNIQNSWELSID